MTQPTPGALTREQFIGELGTLLGMPLAVEFDCGEGPTEDEVQAQHNLILAHDAALRLTLTQQAQEIERLKNLEIELGDLRLRLNCPMLAPSCLVCGQAKPFAIKHLEIKSVGVCEECRSVSQQLAAMTTERDAFQKKYHDCMAILSKWSNIDKAEAIAKLNEVEQQLATEQTRVKELEEARVQWKAEWRSKTQEANISISELQATLAAREARIKELDEQVTNAEEAIGHYQAETHAAVQRAEQAEARITRLASMLPRYSMYVSYGDWKAERDGEGDWVKLSDVVQAFMGRDQRQ